MNHFSHIPNPRKIGHSEFEIGLTETGLPTFCNRLTSFRNIRDCIFGLTEIDQLLSWLKSVSPRLHFRSHRNWHVPVSSQIGLTEFSFSVPPKNSNVHIIYTFGLTEMVFSVPPKTPT